MFASQDIGPRKVFQKPNILRRKTTRKRRALLCESPEDKQLYRVQITENQSINPVKLLAKVTDFPDLFHKEIEPQTHESVKQAHGAQLPNFLSFTIHDVAASNEIPESNGEIQENISPSVSENLHENSLIKQEFYVSKSSLLRQQVDFNEGKQSSLNVESFLLNNQKKENAMSNDSQPTGKKTETEVENKWCLNFMSDDSKDMVMPNFYDMTQIKISTEDINKIPQVTSFSKEINSLQQTTDVSEKEMIIQSCLNSRVVKYKCDIPNCNKSFWNEARLQKHKLVHSKQKTPNASAILECPVKKLNSDGVVEQCGHFFLSRDILVKHLNEDHVPEDAAYKCERRFWWATGMRTHAQSPCTRALVCTWAGCGRVFRQPCRLREHARAHTGDRPYPCDYPNCGWAFRSASKLVRHARRHTGERRHECAACGRAFPRREHLRDHAARYHAPRAAHACTHQGCEQTFAQRNSLFLHMKKVHKIDTKEMKKPTSPKKTAVANNAAANEKMATNAPIIIANTPIKPQTEPEMIEATKILEPKENDGKKMLLMTLDGGALLYGINDSSFSLSDAIETSLTNMIKRDAEITVNNLSGLTEETPESQVDEVKDTRSMDALCRYKYDLEGRCARTYCTWPLEKVEQQPPFTIEEDPQVEQSESSESNIYTVRSDLFLHGNVLINEDSEFIIRESNRASEVEETPNAGQLDGLDLIDAHPTIDLMQNCGWAFRSASKLVRHARRHTGERRHECAACGRAFPRREHLRDHAARYHAPRAAHACTHQGCEQTFAQRNSLFLHMKKVHKIDTKEMKKPTSPKKTAVANNAAANEKMATNAPIIIANTPIKPQTEPEMIEATKILEPKENDGKKMLLMTLDGGALLYGINDSSFSLSDAIETSLTNMIKRDAEITVNNLSGLTEETPESQVDEVKDTRSMDALCRYKYDLEGRCARTYCTWPLEKVEQQPPFTIEEDPQVEQSESSESNIYTVRSDLFLHGNVLINEDSEFIIRESNRASEVEETPNAGQLDGLDLIDAHPTIDLMQEELMYADAAVDESSFRVFMMNGEELS